MSTGGIFLERDGEIVLLQQAAYQSEDILQEVLASFPQFLAGLTTSGDNEGQLLLIRREVSIPKTEGGGGGSFSIDHVFVGRDAVPILVEVKRSTDTRIRREVIGQMLDYAANATRYWQPGTLRMAAELAEDSNDQPTVEQLWSDIDPDEFWNAVDQNLWAGRMRMLFVADELPENVVRIIEFLNEQMSPAEVLGVELRRFVSGSNVAYVPTYVGQTVAAADAKSSRSDKWTRSEILSHAEVCGQSEQDLIRSLLDHGESYGARFSWGKGINPGVTCWYSIQGQPAPVWNLTVHPSKPEKRSTLYFHFQDLANRGLVERVEAMATELRLLSTIRAKIDEASESGWQKYPSLFVEDIASDEDAIRSVFAAIDGGDPGLAEGRVRGPDSRSGG